MHEEEVEILTLCKKRRTRRELKKMDTSWKVAERKLEAMVRRGYRATESQAASYRTVARAAGMSASRIEASLTGISIGETRRQRLRRESGTPGMVIA